MNENDDHDRSGSIEPFENWKRDIDAVMSDGYGINTAEAGIDDDRLRQHWTQKQSPEAFVEWFAAKYDLTPISDWGWYPSKPHALKTNSR